MHVTIISHAKEAMEERGATENEVRMTVETGEMTAAKKGRLRFVKNFSFDAMWRGKYYTTKQVHAIVAPHGEEKRVVTVITKYFGKDT